MEKIFGEVAVIFGGTGFLGAAFAKHILDNRLTERVIIVDIVPIDEREGFRLGQLKSHSDIIFIYGDVRHDLNALDVEGKIGLVANFAAIHREPGHDGVEYYETNQLGAENVSEWASSVGCGLIIFTSSIAPYGIDRGPINEATLPVPETPYGCSKLVAEKINLVWQARDSDSRRLLIVRPGVVFGAGENGNVTRLIKAVLGRYFVYTGNKETVKAGIYVKELCHALTWLVANELTPDQKIVISNLVMEKTPSVAEYVSCICEVAGVRRRFLSLPFRVLLMAAFFINFALGILNIEHPFSPVRIRKLVRSNDVEPRFLLNSGYEFKYGIGQALQDWHTECPEEWGR